ncbi:unnamed protein product [Paramecium sonneborni]|uniref:Transmembrane protein n=1 Tax=Paramecium sonneborni TaxID=65129 RepID=A0A8S1QX72_9CILI|nr:unnamed protein product [Paramecium sonneborni]
MALWICLQLLYSKAATQNVVMNPIPIIEVVGFHTILTQLELSLFHLPFYKLLNTQIFKLPAVILGDTGNVDLTKDMQVFKRNYLNPKLFMIVLQKKDDVYQAHKTTSLSNLYQENSTDIIILASSWNYNPQLQINNIIIFNLMIYLILIIKYVQLLNTYNYQNSLQNLSKSDEDGADTNFLNCNGDCQVSLNSFRSYVCLICKSPQLMNEANFLINCILLQMIYLMLKKLLIYVVILNIILAQKMIIIILLDIIQSNLQLEFMQQVQVVEIIILAIQQLQCAIIKEMAKENQDMPMMKLLLVNNLYKTKYLIHLHINVGVELHQQKTLVNLLLVMVYEIQEKFVISLIIIISMDVLMIVIKQKIIVQRQKLLQIVFQNSGNGKLELSTSDLEQCDIGSGIRGGCTNYQIDNRYDYLNSYLVRNLNK